jgi:2-polyprenyl-3-methyl-5-hydroxy-6-metoxy-1,4-benzoquinol methylase
MIDRAFIDQKVRQFFEELWGRGDPWDLTTSAFEQARYERLFSMIDGRRYRRALEIGCGNGAFTRLLARLADDVIALDISEAAIDRARAAKPADSRVDFRVKNVMEYDPRAE